MTGKWTAPWLMLAAVLGSCAPSVQRFGSPATGLPAGEARTFVMAGEGQAVAAVRQALLDAGLQDREDGELRVEVGFAVRPTRLAVVAPAAGAQEVVSPAAETLPSLCRRQAYVLTVALVERQSGRLKMRNGATISRCRGAPAAVLPVLARTALKAGS